MAKSLLITLKKSPIGEKPKTVGSLRSLGLRRIRQQVEKPDTPDVRGLVNAVRHLVDVEEK